MLGRVLVACEPESLCVCVTTLLRSPSSSRTKGLRRVVQAMANRTMTQTHGVCGFYRSTLGGS